MALTCNTIWFESLEIQHFFECFLFLDGTAVAAEEVDGACSCCCFGVNGKEEADVAGSVDTGGSGADIDGGVAIAVDAGNAGAGAGGEDVANAAFKSKSMDFFNNESKDGNTGTRSTIGTSVKKSFFCK